MSNFIKKHSNLIKKLGLIALVLCISIASFNISNTTARAETASYTITGNVYIKSGNSDFYMVSLNYSRITLIQNGSIVGNGTIDSNGQYTIKCNSVVSMDSSIDFNIITNNSSSYVYLYNSQTNSEQLNLYYNTNFDLYFQYYPFNLSISGNVYHNYTQNSIYISSENLNGNTNTVFTLPNSANGFMRNWEFTTVLRFTSLGSGESSFWLNLYDKNRNYKTGTGVFCNGSSIKLKDNGSNSSYTISVSNVGYSNTYIMCHYKYEVDKDYNLLVTFYCDVADNIYFRNASRHLIINRYNYGEIRQVNIERNRGTFELTNFSLIDNTIVDNFTYNSGYNSGYYEGYKEGEKFGRAYGYNEGVNATQFTFNNLISSVIDAPVKIFTNLFDVEILGVNLKSVVLSLLSLFVVLALVKFLIGKFGG